MRVEDEPKKPKKPKEPKEPKEAKETQNHTTQWPIVFVPEGQWRGRGGPPDRGRRGQRVLRGQRVSRGISRLRRQRRPFFFTRNGVFWDACWSWLGARPRTALWQTGGNGTHAVRSAVGRAVGRTAGQDCGTGGRPTGYSLCKGSIPLGGSPRLLSVARALLPKRVFYLEGGGRKPGQWERARARVRQTWGFFMDVYSGEAYGRRVRALQGETSLQVFR